MKVLTLAYLVTNNKICLGYKKRGFGEGLWNGYGGKVENGETVLGAAVREIKEESTVIVKERDLKEVAQIDFHFLDGSHLHVHTFFTTTWQGDPVETEEMRPEWFPFDAIPYDLMWKDDVHWMPRALKGELLTGSVHFDETDREITKMSWQSVDSF